ncbi:MAG: hypothetical protein ACPGD5_08630 [Salibacteraceae bacterium]
MKYIVIPFLLFTVIISQAQLLDTYQGKLYDGECIFNKKFIKQNKIKRITGKISIKREMHPIYHEGTIDDYTFNEQGQLVERIKSFRLRGGHIDTTQDYFKYNDLEHIVSQTTVTLSGYNSIRFKYDSLGNVMNETYSRGENRSPYSYNLEKGRETILKDESYDYKELSDSSHKKIYFNSANKPYKETIITTNSLGQRISENTRFYLTSKKESVSFQYDVQGRLIKIIDYSNLLGVQTITYTYEYDEFGNLYSSKIYKNGKLTYSQEFLYHVQTFLLKAQLTKEESNNSIKIIEYEYEYF